MMRGLTEHKRFRRTLLLICLVVLLLVCWGLAPRLLSPDTFPVDDFVEYWAAGQLNLTGGNPFSIEELLPVQQAAGFPGDVPIMMWNPPWALPLVIPFALAPYRVDRLLWLVLNVGLLIAAVTYIWWYYRGPPQRRWVALVVLATYWPALWALRYGQITPFILTGVLGFLHFEGRRRWFLAGVFAALVAVKPHLIYLFWFALALWIIDRRAWKVALGTLATLAIGTAIAWLTNHDVIGQYYAAAVSHPPRDWVTPTLGAALRAVFGFERFWLQFLPPLAGVLWFFWYWRRQRVTWRWADQMPLLLVVSLATTPYGWPHDPVVSLLAVLQVAVWATTLPWGWTSTVLLVSYLVLNGMALAQVVPEIDPFWLLWLAPSFLLWYLLARRSLCHGRAVPGSTEEVRHKAAAEAQRDRL